MQNVEEMLTKSDANFSRCAYKEFTKCLQIFLYNIQILVDDKIKIYAVKHLIFKWLNLQKSLKFSNLKEKFGRFFT